MTQAAVVNYGPQKHNVELRRSRWANGTKHSKKCTPARSSKPYSSQKGRGERSPADD